LFHEVNPLEEKMLLQEAACPPDCPHHAHSVAENTGMPDDEALYDLADLFRVFGDSTRIKILYALHDTELCVCDIANLLDMSQSAVSHQLRVLKDSKLVRFRRDGKTVYYALDDDHVRSILSLGMEHVEE
jgi:ArsR family transcriptional regulator